METRIVPFVLALDYDVHDGCPAESVFIAQVLARTSKVRFGEAGDSVVVKISHDGDKSHGELTLDAGATRRALDAATCADVASGLAFALALALDAREPPLEPAPVVRAVPAVAEPAVDRPRPLPRPAVRRRFALGFASEVATFANGQAMVGVWGRARSAAWTLRLAGITGASSVERATFRRTLGSIDGCFGPFIAACVGVEAGFVRASGVGVAEAATVTRGWFAPTVGLRLELQPLDALALEARAGLTAPLVRDTFALQPSTTLYRSGAILPFASLGLAVTIP